MPLPREPFREWREAQLRQLLDPPPAEESARLDFKKACQLLNPDPEAQQRAQRDLLVDIASMANVGGGAILVGVDEDRRPNSPPVASSIPGIPQADAEKLREKIWDLVDRHLDVRPPRPLITCVPAPDEPDKCVVIVEVQQNTYSLSMVTIGGLNQFWHRRTWDNKPMNTDEIQYAFDQMARLRGSAEVELRRLAKRMAEGVSEAVAWIAIVPLKRARDHIPTDPGQLKAAMDARASWKALFGDSRFAECYTAGGYEPFLRGMRLNVRQVGLLSEVHRDGTLAIRASAWDWRSTDGQGAERVKLGNVYRTWVGALSLFRDLGQHFGFPPVAVATVGCLNFRGKKLWWQDAQGDPYELPEDSVTLDPILLSEGYDARDVLSTWAGELANCWGKSKPIPCPPWVGSQGAGDIWELLP